MFGFRRAKPLPSRDQALPGRDEVMPLHEPHHVLGTELRGPFEEGLEQAVFAMGCFWGAEKAFWSLPGVHTTAVGYAGGHTENPTYEEVCSGGTAHTEVVLVVFDPKKIRYEKLLQVFWEGHDPTQGMRQGNDVGTQYRSAIYTFDKEQQDLAVTSKQRYEKQLANAGCDKITTEIKPAASFYYAENHHQQYLSKNLGGYCGIGGTGVCFDAS